MRISIASPIPDMGSMPGPSRPGWGPSGSYDFRFEVSQGQVGITVLPRVNGLRFTIKWQDGTEQAITSAQTNLQSPTTQAGVISINNEKLDTTWCDDFKIASGQNLVTKVLSWGQNPWNNMNNAFSGCTSLSDISTTKFIADSSADIIKMFNGCTSLLEADIRNWDLTAGVSFYGGSPFRDLVNLQKLDMTGLNIKLISRSDYAFAGIGTAVTDGCEFLMSGFNMSTSTAITTPYFFDYSRIKPTSDLSNWVFNPNGFSGTGMFRGIQLTGTNSILNCSGWSTYSGSKFPSFIGGNSGAGNTGAKINFTNLNVSNITDFSTSFQSADFSGIIGLSTWGATAGNVSMYRAFYVAEYFKFSNSDNFSNAFIASLSPSGTGFNQVFQLCGSSISSNFGEAPNLNNIDLSNISSLSSTFESARFYDVPDLSTATFPSTGVSCFKTFKSLQTESSNTHVDFSNVSIKISNAREMFAVSYVDSITFGNNVDFSLCTDVYRKLYQVNYLNTVNITYPTAESGLSWAALTEASQWFTSTTGPTTGPLTTCQVDNLIRSFHNTALNSGLTVDFGLSKITESPSVVSTMVDELENTGGWNITSNTTDATLPFTYPSYIFDSNLVQSVTPSTVPTGGQFSTTSSGVNVNSSTGEVTWSAGIFAAPTIKCTYTDGCYNEVKMFIVDTVPNSYSTKFDGVVDSSFHFPNTTVALGEPWTMSFWFKRNGTPSSRERFLYGGSVTGGWFSSAQEVNTNGQLLMINVNGNFWYWTNTNICDNQWHHIVLQRQPYTPANNYLVMRSYVDGVLDRTAEINDWRYKGGLYNEPLEYIGAGNPVATSFTGHMDEFAVWNSALTQEEITLIYQATSANKMANLSSLPTQPDVWFRLGD